MSSDHPEIVTASLTEQAFASAAGDAALDAFDPAAAQAEAAAKGAASKALEVEKELELLVPVELGKETIRTLRLTEPTMRQLRESQRASSPLAGLSILIHLNTGLLPAVVDKIKQRDLNRIDDFFAQFSRA